MALFLSCDTF